MERNELCDRNRQRLLEIGIGKDDEGRLAAAFEGTALQISRGSLHDPHGRGMMAGEGDLVHARMAGKCRAGDLADRRARH